MNTKVKALSSFVHGRVQLQQGQEAEFTKGDADELAKSGLVEIVGGGEDHTETKMAEPVENKMADAPANKRKTKE